MVRRVRAYRKDFSMKYDYETIIVGGGQGGLATSYFLRQEGREHVVLEQAARAGNAWRNDRWDSFTLVTPNWSFRLPGAEYEGDHPHGFMGRDAVVGRFEAYEKRYDLPVKYGVQVAAVEENPAGEGYRVSTLVDFYAARNVVIATGLYQQHDIPAFSSDITTRVSQFHSGQYRNPQELPPGAVLVVGSGQSGCQISEELYKSGRTVYLCVGNAGRMPRRYRGKDLFEWLDMSNFLDRTVEDLPSPAERFSPNPHVTGHGGGHNLNLHQFARDGVLLLGHLEGADGETIHLARDLHENLKFADEFESELLKVVDSFIEKSGMDAPEERLPQMKDGFEFNQIDTLNLADAGIHSVIWGTGYTFDFSMVKLSVFDKAGFPVQQDGVTERPGLYFAGMPWLSSQGSGLFMGLEKNVQAVAGAILRR